MENKIKSFQWLCVILPFGFVCAVSAQLIEREEFNDSQLDAFEIHGTPPFWDDITFPNNPALKVHLNRSTSPTPYRAEIRAMDLPVEHFSEGKAAFLETEYWYSFRIYFEPEFVADMSREIVTQWHTNLSSCGLSPPVSILTQQSGNAGDFYDHFALSVRSASGHPCDTGSVIEESSYDLGPITDYVGKWTEWVVRVTWSYNSNGSFELWRNGRKILNLQGKNTYEDTIGPIFKIGAYKWPWDPNSPSYVGDPPLEQHIAVRDFWVDDIIFGSSDAIYADVASVPEKDDGLSVMLKHYLEN